MKIKIISLLCLCIMFLNLGCCKETSSAKIIRDEQNIGGDLSFLYDKNINKIFIGEKGEEIQYSSLDKNGVHLEGYALGFKVFAPDEKLDLDSAVLTYEEKRFVSKEFLENINNKVQNFFYLYPIFNKDKMNFKFSIQWSKDTNKQDYEIVLNKDIKFLNLNAKT